MNKKIKIIELFQKYVNGEQMPKTIKNGSFVFNYDDKDKKYYEKGPEKCIYLSLGSFKELENVVEILEDNTEEIEELDEEWTYIEGQVEKTWSKSELELINKINELVKAVNQIRKEKE